LWKSTPTIRRDFNHTEGCRREKMAAGVRLLSANLASLRVRHVSDLPLLRSTICRVLNAAVACSETTLSSWNAMK
jgi:hypothetical protein